MLQENELVKNSTLWLEDGSIVIIAQTTAFRVHGSVLARHSEAFDSCSCFLNLSLEWKRLMAALSFESRIRIPPMTSGISSWPCVTDL